MAITSRVTHLLSCSMTCRPSARGANCETSHAIWNSQHDTRAFLAGSATASAIGFATTVSADMPGLSTVQPVGGGPIDKSRVRPVRVSFPETALHDLIQRVLATRWPEPERVADDAQGLQLATVQATAHYWATDYDWRRCEARLNAERNFMTVIDGLDFRFMHVPSRHDGALALIATHGWPGSIIEQLKIIQPLTNTTAHCGTAADAFEVEIPSLPGYEFSANAIGRRCGRRRGGLRVRPEPFDGISMTCSVAGDRYSWYAANKARQFQWQHPWRYPQVIENTPNVSGQTLRVFRQLRAY
jgi:hypothetical protein